MTAASNGRARLVILISGRGSNMVSILEAIYAKQLNADIVAVISIVVVKTITVLLRAKGCPLRRIASWC